MAAILTRLTHRIAIQLHLVAESCTICSSFASGGQSGNFWIHLRSRDSLSVKCTTGVTSSKPVVESNCLTTMTRFADPLCWKRSPRDSDVSIRIVKALQCHHIAYVTFSCVWGGLNLHFTVSIATGILRVSHTLGGWSAVSGVKTDEAWS
jgi:hypothetical protein